MDEYFEYTSKHRSFPFFLQLYAHKHTFLHSNKNFESMDNHGKKNIEKGNENIKNLYFSFFNISNDSSLEEHNIFYKSNIEKWTNNAIELKYQYPFEIAVYVADLFNSDFTLSFILKSATTNFREAEDWTLEKKVSFIVSYFENGYNYFGLLIHASNYTSSYIAGLEENWVVSIFECLRT